MQLENKTVEIFLATIEPLAPFIDDPEVTEVMVNGQDEVWIERRGVMTHAGINIGQQAMKAAIMTLARMANRDATADNADAIVHARFGDLRIAAVLAPTAQDGHVMCMRKHHRSDLRLDDYERLGSFDVARSGPEHADLGGIFPDERVAEFFRRLVQGRRNILVSGSTGSGKTTFLNALIAEIPDTERVVTIEDTVELRVKALNRVRLLANAHAQITTRLLLQTSLRLRPDRIIVGEVRGEEAFDLLQALNTGHEGGFATLHANDARLALTRLESMVMLGVPQGGNWPLEAIKIQIASCIHYVAHFRRKGNLRYLSEVIRLEGYRNGEYVTERVY